MKTPNPSAHWLFNVVNCKGADAHPERVQLLLADPSFSANPACIADVPADDWTLNLFPLIVATLNRQPALISALKGVLSVPEARKALANWGTDELLAARRALDGLE